MHLGLTGVYRIILVLILTILIFAIITNSSNLTKEEKAVNLAKNNLFEELYAEIIGIVSVIIIYVICLIGYVKWIKSK